MTAVAGPVLEVVSGLARPSAAEQAFIATLEQTLHVSLHARLSVEALSVCCPEVPLLLLVPVLGDNDLHPRHFETLATLSQHAAFATKRILIVLHGDRHAWDTPASTDPIVVKLRNLCYFSPDLYLHTDKLDLDTVSTVAQQVLAQLTTSRDSAVPHLASIAMLVQRAPAWDANRQQLDFYDPTSGFSVLHGQSQQAVAQALEHASRIDATTLCLTNAGLTSGHLAEVAYSARRVDLTGNAFTLPDAVRAFPRAEWLSMAVNGLTQVDLAVCPSQLEQLYLHKNAIDTLHFPAGLACQLKALSLYRNRLQQLSLPNDQTALHKLNLGANPITALPDALRDAQALRFLGIARTHIRALPKWLYALPSLQQIDISYIEHQLPAADLAQLAERGIDIIRKPSEPS